MERSVVFILSTNYAGSHFASLMLGSHSGASHVGEVHHLRKESTSKDLCARCGGTERCPLFKNVVPGEVDGIFEHLFSVLPPEKRLIVDTSKKPDWAERFLGRPGFRAKVLHLIRDPRALVRRWEMYYVTPEQVWRQRKRRIRESPLMLPRLLLAPPRLLFAYKWLEQNRKITALIRARRIDHRAVTYMDLAKDPEGELRRLDEWLGLDYEPGQVEYWKHEHHGTRKDEYASGAPEGKRLFDARWKEFLPPGDQERIASNPLILRYLSGVGVRITPDGLTRNA